MSKKIDKRSKAYRESVKAQEPQVLGDTVEKVLEATGIAKVAKFIMGDDCGCDERRESLNKAFPYYKPLCLEENEYEVLKAYFDKGTSRVTYQEQLDMIKVYNRVFKQKTPRATSDCASCVREMVSNLRKLYDEYK